jgi:glutamyl-tRNA synthetase
MKKVAWLVKANNNLIPIDLVSFDHLITKHKPQKQDGMEKFMTPITELRIQTFDDCNMVEVPLGSVIKFERKGYYRIDVAYQEGSRAVLFDIPSKG